MAMNYNQMREYNLNRRYGITIAEYDNLLNKQEGRCAICNTPNSLAYNGLHVDHCHDTGKVRKLLCHTCNQGLGIMNDDINRMESAAKYLRDKGK